MGTWSKGVYYSVNNGANWTAVNDGLPAQNSDIYSISVNGNKLFAGTYDYGVWSRPITGLVGIKEHKTVSGLSQKQDFKILPQSLTRSDIKVSFFLNKSELVNFKIFNISGHEIMCYANKQFTSGEHTLSLGSLHLTAGCYIVKMQAGSDMYVKNIPITR